MVIEKLLNIDGLGTKERCLKGDFCDEFTRDFIFRYQCCCWLLHQLETQAVAGLVLPSAGTGSLISPAHSDPLIHIYALISLLSRYELSLSTWYSVNLTGL